MKKFIVVLMAMALAIAFAVPASALDIKVNGQWYMAGWYANNPSLLDKDMPSGDVTRTSPRTVGADVYLESARQNRASIAFYTHKLRLNTTFQIVEGLALKTQIDALEAVMGDATWAGGAAGRASQQSSSRTSQGASGAAAQESIEFEAAWVDFKVPFGRFQVGYVPNGIGFGTAFLIDPYTWPTIRFDTQMGPLNMFASIFKIREWRNSDAFLRGGVTASGLNTDADSDAYRIGLVYKMKPGEVGIMYELWRDARAKARAGLNLTTGTGALPGALIVYNGYNDITAGQWGIQPIGTQGWVTQISTVNPYFKLTLGPVYLEGEGYYRFGKLRRYETFTAGNVQQPDIDLAAWGAYLQARATFKPFYVGGIFVYMSGDDLSKTDKATGSIAQLMGDNYAFNPCLILWNFDYVDAMGWTTGNIPAYMGNPRTLGSYQNTRYMDNVFFYQIYAGMFITPKLDVVAKLAYAYADKKPRMGVGPLGTVLTQNTTNPALAGLRNREFVSDKYGTEFDLLANYKIYANLTYTVGFGYLWTGDYFKGYDPLAVVKNNYVVMHKLNLMF
ncbi:MAG: hypothetical protein N2572_08100 [Syntrophales bacterium]|nr:hypothetical protein [Syntrophales bacterium]